MYIIVGVAAATLTLAGMTTAIALINKRKKRLGKFAKAQELSRA
jgi:hypothetical protein